MENYSGLIYQPCHRYYNKNACGYIDKNTQNDCCKIQQQVFTTLPRPEFAHKKTVKEIEWQGKYNC